MPTLKGHHRGSKTGSRPNPYAERGLDQFALVSAELQETREKLLAQFGTSLSLIRFAIGPDQTKWIPVIVSQKGSSNAEVRALRRAASDLIIGNKHALDGLDAGNRITAAPTVSGGHGHAWNDDTHLGGRVAADSDSRSTSNNSHVGSGISECDGHLGDEISIESSGVAHIDNKHVVDVLAGNSKAYHRSYLMAAIQGFVWVLKVIVFSSRIAADIASNAILSKRHTEDIQVRTLRPSKDVSAFIDNPSADIASTSSQPHGSYPPPRSTIAKDNIKSMKPLPPLTVEAPKTRKISRFPSAPSTPRASRQLEKPFQACASFPKTPQSRGDAPHIDIKENERAQKLVPNIAKETVSEKHRKESIVSERSGQRKDISAKLGQALTGAGLMVILCGLVMGYIPGIVGVVCWWYMLPSMRKAVGDKPFVRSHHHHSSPEDRNANTINNKARGKHVGSEGNEDMHMHSHEDKKKLVTTDRLLDRRHRNHSQA